jgi:hypothetical protein
MQYYTTTLILAVASLAAAQSTTSSAAATSSATGINQSGCGGAIDAYEKNTPTTEFQSAQTIQY